MSFENKVVLITGASSGIGAATAKLFSKRGASVAMVGRNEVKLQKVAKECSQNSKTPLVIIADVSDDDDVKRIVKETIDKFGKLDVLVNNAGVGAPGHISDGKITEAYDKIMNTNVRAAIQLTTLTAPYLIETKGNIVNISSSLGKFITKSPGYLAYSVSKAALDHFTRGAALELSSSGVRVNGISPGPVRTDFLENAGDATSWDDFVKLLPLKRVSEPEEVADLILYLASDKAKGITGSDFICDNGLLLMRNND